MFRTPFTVLALVVGHAIAAPQIDALDSPSETRSGLVVIHGSGFGAAQGSSTVLVGGLPAIATTWSDSELHVYVPETASLGTVGVQIASATGDSNTVLLDVEARQSNGHLLWRFEFDSPFSGEYQAVGSDGTVYATDHARLYALSPNGALEWISTAVGGGRPIDFLADGSVVGATNLDIVVLNPADGSVLWSYSAGQTTLQHVQAGPNVGPDGNIYAIAGIDGSDGLGMFSLTPGGQLRWDNPGDPILDPASVGNNNQVVFTSRRAFVAFKYFAVAPPFVLGFDQNNGNQPITLTDCSSLPIAGPDDKVILSGGCGIRAHDQDGNENWTHSLASSLIPVIASDGTIYTGSFLNRLVTLDQDGSVQWEAGGVDVVKVLGVTPDASVVVHTLAGFGTPQTVAGWAGDGSASLWSVPLRTIDGHFELVHSRYASFSPSGDATYFISRLTSNGARGGLYAIATGEAAGCPADLTGSSNPSDPAFGTPDGILDANDYFYYLDRFAVGDFGIADLTGSTDPNDPSFGTPDGILDANDFFFYLTLFAAGCP